MAENKKEEEPRKSIFRRIWERIIRTFHDGSTQAGKVDLRSREWHV